MPESTVARLLADLVSRLPLVVPVVGLYAAGSLGTRDFEPERSDLDLVAVLERPLEPEELRALTSIHRELTKTHPGGSRLHCLYAAVPTIRDGEQEWPYWAEGKFRTRRLSAITRLELHDHGVVVAGQPIAGQIPYVTPDELVDDVHRELRTVWMPASRKRLRWLEDPWVDLGLTVLPRAQAALEQGLLLTKTQAIAELSTYDVPDWLRQDMLARRRGWARSHGLRFRVRRARVARRAVHAGVEHLLTLG
jgi:PAS domain-containing protein